MYVLSWAALSLAGALLATGLVARVRVALYVALRWLVRSADGAPLSAQRARRQRFLAAVGPRYGYTHSAAGHVDGWRATEFPGLLQPMGRPSPPDAVVYLDYAGAALPTASQVQAISVSAQAVLANPHSAGPAAEASANAERDARAAVLAHFCGDSAAQWAVIWTSGATGALRLAAETFPFGGRSRLAFPRSVHTSVLGMRGPAA